jgi:hypothetical protein
VEHRLDCAGACVNQKNLAPDAPKGARGAEVSIACISPVLLRIMTAMKKNQNVDLNPFAVLERIQALGRRSGPMLFHQFERSRDGVNSPAAVKKESAPMIHTLTVKCFWGSRLTEPCTRVIEMENTATLFDLHEAIQNAVNFDRDHCFEFFAGRHCRKRALLFSDNDDWGIETGDSEPIELSRIWPLPDKMKLFYWFDFGDDWKFQITKGRYIKAPEKGARYPRCIKKVGPNPAQYGSRDDDTE